MGKYTEQVHSYSNGVSKIKSGLEETLLELQEVDEMLKNDNSDRCLLNYYVHKFNEDIIKEIEILSSKCFSVPTLLLKKANELDEQIALANTSDNTTLGISTINGNGLTPIFDLKSDTVEISDINVSRR